MTKRFPVVPLACTLLLAALAFLPRVHGNQTLMLSVLGAAGVMFTWELGLWASRRGKPDAFPVEFVPIKSHWVQACVQFSILLYWGMYWENVYQELPLILAQILYLYSFEALITWSRGRTWRMGFGPLPIIISTNLLLWFRDDYFYLQFVMVTLGVMGKQFMMWKLAERKSHIFNPSAFGQSLIAVVLIATATTQKTTWGADIAATFEAPYMLFVIFAGGLIVQYLFHVTLMTMAAAATLCAVNIIYTWFTGVYFFVDISIAAPIFLGIHLLITDPSTSPKSNVGRVIFGSAYALGYCILFRVLDIAGVPIFWDKLLPVPILNLCVPGIDWISRHGVIGRINAAWEGALSAGRMNLVHMACWIALFAAMALTGFIYGPHPGDSIPFWKEAVRDGKPHAERSLARAIASFALGQNDAAAYNELGLLSLSGKGVPQSADVAADSFCKACELGSIEGCENVAMQLIFRREGRSQADVDRAFSTLEAACNAGASAKACYLLGQAYETGRGRPKDLARALQMYLRGGPGNGYIAKALARLALSGTAPAFDVHTTATAMTLLSQQNNDAEASWYSAYMYNAGIGVPKNPQVARMFMQRACEQGSQMACEALKAPELPPYRNPVMVVPGWSTAYPLPEQAPPPARTQAPATSSQTPTAE